MNQILEIGPNLKGAIQGGSFFLAAALLGIAYLWFDHLGKKRK
jgi:hypothetical protein